MASASRVKTNAERREAAGACVRVRVRRSRADAACTTALRSGWLTLFDLTTLMINTVRIVQPSGRPESLLFFGGLLLILALF